MTTNISPEGIKPNEYLPIISGRHIFSTKENNALRLPLQEKGTPVIDQAIFRSVLGQFGSGMTIVTLYHEGRKHGITVSSFCSLSLTPPLILVCIDCRSQSHELMQKTENFAVNILAEDDEWIARQFASRVNDKFANLSTHRGVIDAPLLDTALAILECQLVDLLPGGDHSIFVGKVLAAKENNDARPLLYHKSKFHHIPRPLSLD
jgi:flavin reductase (DIM6/NTAB) family NADH-FMN oxidoreductase RutF